MKNSTRGDQQVRMGPAILTALCLWSCVLTVTPLDTKQVERVTNYIEQNIFKKVSRQFTYFVKFTKDECNKGLTKEDIGKALKKDKAADIPAALEKGEIFIGDRIVAAYYTGKSRNYDHAEYRLLVPLGNAMSPIQTLLEDKDAGCVVFFSLISPCVGKCTKIKDDDNIIHKLNDLKVELPSYQNRAFAYKLKYRKDKNKSKEEFLESWGPLNHVMPLLRCIGYTCYQCFTKNPNDGRYELDDQCLKK